LAPASRESTRRRARETDDRRPLHRGAAWGPGRSTTETGRRREEMQQSYPPYDAPAGGLERAADLARSGDAGTLWLVVLGAVALAVAILVLVAIVRRLLYIARPNEALIFSGKRYVTEDGQTLGYKVVRQGRRALKI